MLPTPAELREESRLCRKIAEDVAAGETHVRLAQYAFLLALRAEAAEREKRGTDAREDERVRIERWRRHAEELRAIAADFSVPSAQDSFRGIADNYDQLADETEARSTIPSQGAAKAISGNQ